MSSYASRRSAAPRNLDVAGRALCVPKQGQPRSRAAKHGRCFGWPRKRYEVGQQPENPLAAPRLKIRGTLLHHQQQTLLVWLTRPIGLPNFAQRLQSTEVKSPRRSKTRVISIPSHRPIDIARGSPRLERSCALAPSSALFEAEQHSFSHPIVETA
jgi:hypothetical protein